MRVFPLSAVLGAGLLGLPAMAQTYAPQPPAAPPAYAPPAYAPPSYAQPGYPPAGAATPQGVPAGTNVDTGARPGNPIGAGVSMPMGSRASNIDQQDTRSTVAPNLPGPELGSGATPQDYLRSAQGALAAGRTGEAQQALEMAQTRMLDRSVPYGQTDTPSASPAVAQISQALRALAAHDRAGCMAAIQAALSAPQ